jgi:carboxypeptidase family protein
MKVLAMAALFLLQQAQTAPPPANVQQTPKSTIEGFVLRAGTSEAIARTRITISRVSGPAGLQLLPGQMALPQVTTDSQGRFLIKDLEEGSYRLFAQRNGFARQEYGERAPGRGGTLLSLQAGQAMKDVMFRLTPAGAVNGRISDSVGDPIAGLVVTLLRPSYDGAGRRNYQPAQTARTNDHGEYRIYWVTPGRYYLSAAPGRPVDFPGNGNEVIDPGYATTYYPGTTDASLATAVEVQPGAELSTIDLTMVQQQVFTIRGRVLDGTTGQSPRQASVMIMPRRFTGPFTIGATGPTYNPGNGTFELRDVVPGSYWVRVMVFPTIPGPTTQPISTQVPVEVSGSNIENLVIPVSRGFSIPGRVTLDGGGSVSNLSTTDSVRVFLQPTVPDVVILGNQPGVVTAEGTFLLENVSPGDYRVFVAPTPPNSYIKSVRFGNVDALQDGLSISGSISTGLEIVLSTNAAQIEGTVVDKDRKPVAGIQAVLIPDRRDRRDLFKTVTSDQNGRFTLRGVAPADYRLFAWEDLEPFAYNDPEILRRYEQQGSPIKISESAKSAVEVTMIPAGQ